MLIIYVKFRFGNWRIASKKTSKNESEYARMWVTFYLETHKLIASKKTNRKESEFCKNVIHILFGDPQIPSKQTSKNESKFSRTSFLALQWIADHNNQLFID